MWCSSQSTSQLKEIDWAWHKCEKWHGVCMEGRVIILKENGGECGGKCVWRTKRWSDDQGPWLPH